ncbi:ParB/RepB/Spo0J family partition protein [Paramaledivibacter caminithermalis]|uniref:Chromosome segregation DNA-binding protein n=1 Tax=Paramaledivibacter caminithermalis (strain DSM 15212 / CIP 107654 / DViRD3) TaxID=1121301 RepID=A0A1M6NYG3_PARC5|nr:ParB/RepB/Spo0J family partition protein [Paramaledivibacter caminithermalis]SHK00733.1 chromosome segregation DNA-binding protein [Paramaledivibacter caminithermalis DSM 15212]
MAKAKRGLGKGLDALIPQNFGDNILDKEKKSKESIRIINIDDIKPNMNQPRKYFNKEKIKSLEESILNHGIIQPIIVRKLENGYEIVAGERRWRAAKNSDLKEIPCIIKELDDEKLMELSLIENLQREDLNEIEEALAYKRLNEEFGMTQDKIGKIVGKSRPYIANILRLLNLDNEIKEMIIEGKISGGHGRALLRIENTKLQRKIAFKIISENLTVRETEKLVSGLINKNKEAKKKNNKKRDSSIIYIEESLKEILGTKVNIINGKKKGKIEIEYYSAEDLERIIEFLKK